MTEKEYRSHPALSRSELWQFHKSAEWFKWKKDHPSEPTPALLFGQVAHKLLLEPEDFDTDFAVAPVVDKRTKVGKEMWAQFCADADGKTVVDADIYEQCMAMVSAARLNPLVNDLLEGNHEEPLWSIIKRQQMPATERFRWTCRAMGTFFRRQCTVRA